MFDNQDLSIQDHEADLRLYVVGFGSMLRAIGAQIEKTTNREACRDLSGRRLRDINEEKRYILVMNFGKIGMELKKHSSNIMGRKQMKIKKESWSIKPLY